MYVGGSLTALFDDVPQALTVKCAKDMCDEGAKSLESIARMNTPVRSGELRASWKRAPAQPGGGSTGDPTWEATVSTDVDYAPYVEYGTGLYGPKHAPYLILPKKPGGTLRWIGKDGNVVFAKHALHPGSPGHFMMQTALLVTDAAAQGGELFEGHLHQWAADIEAHADTGA